MKNLYIKANRIFTPLRKYAWIFTMAVAIGGLWYPKLGILVFGIIFGLTVTAFFKGRYWCGNFCPHGSLFDHILVRLSPNRKIPKFFKSFILKALVFGFFAFQIGRKLIKVFAIYDQAAFFDKLGMIFVSSYLMVLIVGGVLALTINSRTWCNFCPMGTLQVLSYKLGKLLKINKKTDQKISVSRTEMCHTCGKCSRVCPLQLTPYLEFNDSNQFDNETCIRCGTCVENCPAGILTINNEYKAHELIEQTKIIGYDHRQKIQSKVQKITKLKDDVITYTFEFIQPKKVQYKAGEFILVKIQNDPEMFRAYSISSYNQDGTSLSVTIKQMKDGYGTGIMFNDFKEGDLVELEGPMGHELVVDKNSKKVLLVAGGIGITPFVPIVKDLVENKNDIEEFTLVYGANFESEFLYDEVFAEFEQMSDKFKFIKVAAFDENWQGRKGFVTDIIKEMDLDDYKVYMCGPKPMTDATVRMLKQFKFNEENIFFESA